MEIQGVTVMALGRREDARGWLFEAWRSDQPPEGYTGPAMAYVSFTKKDVARGPHEHKDQTDAFVFMGRFILTLWDARPMSPTSGNKMDIEVGGDAPALAIVPPGVVHAYKALEDGLVLNLPDRLYAGWGKNDKVDEIRHEADPGSPYKLEGNT